jgi:hypothetical protein
MSRRAQACPVRLELRIPRRIPTSALMEVHLDRAGQTHIKLRRGLVLRFLPLNIPLASPSRSHLACGVKGGYGGQIWPRHPNAWRSSRISVSITATAQTRRRTVHTFFKFASKHRANSGRRCFASTGNTDCANNGGRRSATEARHPSAI